MTRQRLGWIGTTLALTYLFLARDAGHPDAVAGATRRVMPARVASPQPSASSLPPRMSVPSYNVPAPVDYTSAPAASPTDPGEVLVSASVPPPPPPPRPRAPAPAPASGTSSNRTFEGKVESVVADGTGSTVRLVVVLVNVFGERFKFVMEPDTPIYEGDEPAPETKIVAPGDQLLVKYIPRRDNLAIRVKIEI